MVDSRNGGVSTLTVREFGLETDGWEDNIHSSRLYIMITYMASGPSQPPKTVSLVSMLESPAVIVAHLSLLL